MTPGPEEDYMKDGGGHSALYLDLLTGFCFLDFFPL